MPRVKEDDLGDEGFSLENGPVKLAKAEPQNEMAYTHPIIRISFFIRSLPHPFNSPGRAKLVEFECLVEENKSL